MACLGVAATSISFADVQTEMRVFSDSFISPSFEATQKTQYQFVGGQLKTQPFSDDALRIDISAGVAVGAPLLNYLNIPEFYLKGQSAENETIYIGRKRMLWSELDAQWNLGVWEPVFKWNPLNPERQGLTGFFWQVDRPLYSVALFASPFYIPDQGPSFEIENGQFVKGNPWFRRPPESVTIWEEATDVQYEFERPSESQIVLQNSFGARLLFGEGQGLRGQLSYIYKPINQLAVGYKGSLDLAELKGHVELQPQVSYHSLVGADVVYKNDVVRAGISGIFEHPSDENLFEESWTRPMYSDAYLISPFVEWNFKSWAFNFQRLDIIGGEVTVQGDDANQTPLMARYPFRQANQLSILTQWSLAKARKWSTKLSYMVPDRGEFQLIRFTTRLRLSGLWSIIADGQLVKADNDSSNQSEIAQFENNDRFMIGAGYVF